MAKECFQIKFKGASSNANLPEYLPNSASFFVRNTTNASDSVVLAYSISQSDDTKVKIYDENGTLVSTTTVVPSNNSFSVPANTKYRFLLNNIDKLRYMSFPSSGFDVELNIDLLSSSFNDAISANYIKAPGSAVSGGISAFHDKGMTSIQLSNTVVSGNVSALNSGRLGSLFVNGSNLLTGDFLDVLKNTYLAGKESSTLRIYCSPASMGFKVKMNGQDISSIMDFTATFSANGFTVAQTGGSTTLITATYSGGEWTIS